MDWCEKFIEDPNLRQEEGAMKSQRGTAAIVNQSSTAQEGVRNASQSEKDEAQLTRRRFCATLAVTSAGLTLAATSIKAKAANQQNPALVYPPQKIEGAETLLPGSSLYFTYPTRNDSAVLVRAFDGQFYAYGLKCSHLGCSVYYSPTRQNLVCPCHKGSYDVRTGDVMSGPPQRPLEQILLQVRTGDQVWAVGKRSNKSNETWARAGR